MNKLVPYTEFDTDSLAEQLNYMVLEPGQINHLTNRRFLGTLARYASDKLDVPKKNVEKAQNLHQAGKLGAFIIEADSKLVGAASIQAQALRKQPVGLPPKFVQAAKLTKSIDVEGPNIAAWLNNSYFTGTTEARMEGQRLLEFVYCELVVCGGDFDAVGKDEQRPWTIEPVRSSPYVHRAIEGAMNKGGTGYYDDNESSANFLPKSILYVAEQKNEVPLSQ